MVDEISSSFDESDLQEEEISPSSLKKTSKKVKEKPLPEGYEMCTDCQKRPTRFYVSNCHTRYTHCGWSDRPFCITCWTPSFSRNGPYVLGDNYLHTMYFIDDKNPENTGIVSLSELHEMYDEELAKRIEKSAQDEIDAHDKEQQRLERALKTYQRNLKFQNPPPKGTHSYFLRSSRTPMSLTE